MDTARLRLSLIAPENLEGFHRIWSNDNAAQWSSRGTCKTLEDSRQWMSGLLPENNPEGLNYAVSILPEGENEQPQMIGIVGVYSTSPSAELGYTFHPSAWGRGYATESILAFIELFWKKRPTVEIMEAKTDHKNYASMRVLTRCGFKEIKRLNEESVVLSKEPDKRDVVVFQIKAPTPRT